VSSILQAFGRETNGRLPAQERPDASGTYFSGNPSFVGEFLQRAVRSTATI
jgi:hypothetical protein